MLMRAIAFLLAVAAGLAASQAPEFAQQYRQRLGGAVDELSRVIAGFDQNAATAGTDRAGGLAVMARNSEVLVREQALSMAETIIRHDRLSKQQEAFRDSAPFVRLTSFVQDFDRPLVESTLRDFEPAVPATAEGVVFASVGFLVIYFLLHFLGFLFRRPRRHHHHQPTAERA